MKRYLKKQFDLSMFKTEDFSKRKFSGVTLTKVTGQI